jgi:chromosome segregation ATPase
MVMPIVTGRQTLSNIEQALNEVSKKVERLNAELDQANQDKARTIANRLAAFEDLARFRTKLALLDGVIDEADQLSAQVRGILQARQKTLDALTQREVKASKERAQLIAKQETLDENIERLEGQIDALGDKARKALSSDAAYIAHVKRHEELESMAAKASEKAEKSLTEEAQKGAPYRGDPLFMYLWDRKYGTSDYRNSGLIRTLDGWVARLIGYQDARANFAILTAIPERLSAHAERLKQMAHTEQLALEAMEADAIRALAGADLEKQLRLAHDQREEHVAKLAQLNTELLETGHQLKLYAEGLDQSFKEGIEKTTKFLEGQSLNALLAEARKTPDPGDDEIVSLIRKLAEELAALERLAKTKRTELDTAFERKQELLRIASEFRRSRYDRPGSVFEPGSGGEALLNLLLQGAITAAEYWLRTQRGYRPPNRSGDSYRRSESFPMGGGREGARSRGPDFRTGGGF